MRAKLTKTDLRDWWLKKYFNTTSVEVAAKYPEESKSSEWFKLFPVTKEQHDEWYEWAISELSKQTRRGKKVVRKLFQFEYLDCAPHYDENDKLNIIE